MFAILYTAAFRVFGWWIWEYKFRAAGMIFCVQCLNLYNEYVTILATLVAHTLADAYIYEGVFWPIPPRTIIFNALYMSAIALIGYGLKLRYKKSPTDKDPVFSMIFCSCVLYMLIRKQLIYTQGWDETLFERNGPALGYIGWELSNTILLIFVTGPFKIWLDIKRGSTTLKDIETDL